MRPRPIRAPATRLPNRVVEEIVLGVIQQYGYLNLDAAVCWLSYERARRSTLLFFPGALRHIQEQAPTGAA